MAPSFNLRYLEEMPTSLSRINERSGEADKDSPNRNYKKVASSSALHDNIKNTMNIGYLGSPHQDVA